MTFSGQPPFDQSGTPSPPAPTPGEKLPHTGTDDGILPYAAMTLLLAVGAGVALLRAER